MGVKHTPMASAGAYNGGLGAEPPAGVQGAELLVADWRVRGRSPPAADEVFVFKTVIFNASATVLHEMMYSLIKLSFFCKASK